MADKNTPELPDTKEIQKSISQVFKALYHLKDTAGKLGIADMFDDMTDSLRKNTDRFNRTLKRAEKDHKKGFKLTEQCTEIADKIAGVTKIKMTGKNLEFLLKYLTKTKLTVEKLSGVLAADFENLEPDLKCLTTTLQDLTEEEAELLNDLAHNLDDAADSFDGMGSSLSGMVEKFTDQYAKLSDHLKNTPQISMGGIQTDAMNAVRNLKSVQQSLMKDLVNKKVELGVDSGTFTHALGQIKDSYRIIEDSEAVISDLLANRTEANAKYTDQQIQKQTDRAAKEVAITQRRITEMEENAEAHREVMDIASSGYLALAQASQESSDLLKEAFDSMKSGDLVSALKAYKDSRKMKAKVSAASSIMSQESEGSRIMVTMASAFGKMSMAVGMVAMLVQLFIAARDHAVSLNKKFVEGAGLIGMGVKVNANTSTADITKVFDKARDGLVALDGSMFDFGATQDEKQEVLNALAKQGQTTVALQKQGLDYNQAVKGAFTYSQMWGKSHTEVADLMGKMSMNLNMSMERTESQFGAITESWQGSKLSIDDFISTVDDITTENAIFGNRIDEVTNLLGITGKNALLGSKQAIDAQKKFSDMFSKFSPDKMASLIEQVGVDEVKKMSQDQVNELKQKLAKLPDQTSDEAKGLKERIGIIDRTWKAYEAGGDSMQLRKLLPQFSMKRQQGFMFKAMLKTAANSHNITEEAMSKMDISEVFGTLFDTAQLRAEMGDEEFLLFEKYLIGLAPATGKVGELVKNLDALDTKMGADAAAVKRNNDAANKAARLQIDTDKALQIMQEALLTKLYGKMSGIETLIGNTVGLITKIIHKVFGKSEAEQDAENAQASATHASSASGDTKIKEILATIENLQKAKKSGGTAGLQALWKTIPEDIQKEVRLVANKDYSNLETQAKGLEGGLGSVVSPSGLQTATESAQDIFKTVGGNDKGLSPPQAKGLSPEFIKNMQSSGMQAPTDKSIDVATKIQAAMGGNITAGVSPDTIDGAGNYVPATMALYDKLKNKGKRSAPVTALFDGYVSKIDPKTGQISMKAMSEQDKKWYGLTFTGLSSFSQKVGSKVSIGDALGMSSGADVKVGGFALDGGDMLIDDVMAKLSSGAAKAFNALAASKMSGATAQQPTFKPSNAAPDDSMSGGATVYLNTDVVLSELDRLRLENGETLEAISKTPNYGEKGRINKKADGGRVPPGFQNDSCLVGLTSGEVVLNKPQQMELASLFMAGKLPDASSAISKLGLLPSSSTTNNTSNSTREYNYNIKVDDQKLLQRWQRMQYESDRKKAYNETGSA